MSPLKTFLYLTLTLFSSTSCKSTGGANSNSGVKTSALPPCPEMSTSLRFTDLWDDTCLQILTSQVQTISDSQYDSLKEYVVQILKNEGLKFKLQNKDIGLGYQMDQQGKNFIKVESKNQESLLLTLYIYNDRVDVSNIGYGRLNMEESSVQVGDVVKLLASMAPIRLDASDFTNKNSPVINEVYYGPMNGKKIWSVSFDHKSNNPNEFLTVREDGAIFFGKYASWGPNGAGSEPESKPGACAEFCNGSQINCKNKIADEATCESLPFKTGVRCPTTRVFDTEKTCYPETELME